MPDDSPMTKTQSPFAEARVLAARALDLAQRHRVPPFPRAYEVWFTYVGGTNPALQERIDAALRSSRGLSPGMIDQIHAEFLSPGAVNAGMERLGDRMDSDLAEVIDLIEGGIAHGDALSTRIEKADMALGIAVGDTEGTRRAVGELLRDARHHTRAIARMGDSLETMRKQFTAMQRELRELRQSVLIDELTQLPNRRFFDEALRRMAAEGAREGAGLALILIDLDHFRAFNDRWGRAAGDTVIGKCAAILRTAARDGDVACRLGGDGFALLLPGVRAERAEALADGLRVAISEIRLVRSTTGEAVARLSASACVACLGPGESGQLLHARAEDGLSVAKGQGRDRVVAAA